MTWLVDKLEGPYFSYFWYLKKKLKLRKSWKNSRINTNVPFTWVFQLLVVHLFFFPLVETLESILQTWHTLLLNSPVSYLLKKNFLLNNHSAVITFKKRNIDKILLLNVQFIFKFPQFPIMSSVVFCFH